MSKNFEVIDVKPKNSLVIDTKPKMINMTQPVEQEQMYSVTIGAGMYMGIPVITYPTAQTFNSPTAP